MKDKIRMVTSERKEYKNEWRKNNPGVEKDYIKNGHRAYGNMKSRCNNPNFTQYKDYGARGIRCLLTRDEFLEIYFRTDKCENCGIQLNDQNRKAMDGRNVDRINSGGHYSKDNIRIVCKKCNSFFAKKRK